MCVMLVRVLAFPSPYFCRRESLGVDCVQHCGTLGSPTGRTGNSVKQGSRMFWKRLAVQVPILSCHNRSCRIRYFDVNQFSEECSVLLTRHMFKCTTQGETPTCILDFAWTLYKLLHRRATTSPHEADAGLICRRGDYAMQLCYASR